MIFASLQSYARLKYLCRGERDKAGEGTSKTDREQGGGKGGGLLSGGLEGD